MRARSDSAERSRRRWADVAQLAEHVLGKDEVTGSIPVIGSRLEITVAVVGVVRDSRAGRSRGEVQDGVGSGTWGPCASADPVSPGATPFN